MKYFHIYAVPTDTGGTILSRQQSVSAVTCVAANSVGTLAPETHTRVHLALVHVHAATTILAQAVPITATRQVLPTLMLIILPTQIGDPLICFIKRNIVEMVNNLPIILFPLDLQSYNTH